MARRKPNNPAMESKAVDVNSAHQNEPRPNLDTIVSEGAARTSQQSEEDPEMFCGVHRSILEAFDNLPMWNKDIQYERQKILERSFLPPEDKTESHAMKLIHERYGKFPEKANIKLPPFDTVDQKPCYLPGLPQHYCPLLPKRSVLTCSEQYKLYYLYKYMAWSRNIKQDNKKLAELQELRTKVAEEYVEFQEFAKSQWCKGQWQRVLRIPPQVETFINSLWKMRAQQCLKFYQNDYYSVKQIPLSLNDANDGYSVLEFVKTIVTQSRPLGMSLPKIRSGPVTLVSELQNLCRIKPITTEQQNRPEPLGMENVPVSVDSYAEQLVTQKDLDVDIVISMSGIKTLTDINKFHNDWMLPITVKEVFKEDGETRKKVVFIDKNLPPNKMSVHDKNLWHAKVVAKWMLVLSARPNLFDDPPKSEPKDLPAPAKKLLNTTSPVNSPKTDQTPKAPAGTLARPEVKAGPTPACQNPWSSRDNTLKLENTMSKKRRSQRLICYDDPFTDFTGEDIEEFGIGATPAKATLTQTANEEQTELSSKTTESSPPKKAKKKINVPEPGTISNGSQGKPQVNTSEPRTGLQRFCRTYQMWKIHKSNFNQFLKTEQRTLNLMVRTRNDGKLFHYENNIKMKDDVCVSSKVEFQPEYGAAKMTLSELTREYVDLYMRPGAKLVRVRSIGHTKEVMLTEVKTLNDIKIALQAEINFVQKLFDPLYAVLTKLADLPPGQYMLHHTAKMGAFATLLKGGPGSSQFNLTQFCSGFTAMDINVPPVPIDPLVITALHHRDRVAPALFTPAPNSKDISAGFFKKKHNKLNKNGKKQKSVMSKKRAALKKKEKNLRRAAEKKVETEGSVDFFGGELPQNSD